MCSVNHDALVISATVQKNIPALIIRSPRDTGEIRNGDKTQEGLRFLTRLHAVERLDKQAVTRATVGMGPDQAPRSAVERDDFDLTQRRGRKSAKNEYNLKLPKFNRLRGAWRFAGAYIGGGHKYSCAMA